MPSNRFAHRKASSAALRANLAPADRGNAALRLDSERAQKPQRAASAVERVRPLVEERARVLGGAGAACRAVLPAARLFLIPRASDQRARSRTSRSVRRFGEGRPRS